MLCTYASAELVTCFVCCCNIIRKKYKIFNATNCTINHKESFFIYTPSVCTQYPVVYHGISSNAGTVVHVILSLEAPNKFGESIIEFGETHSSVLGCERRPVSASIMSSSCFSSFPVCVYKFSIHYFNNIIFYRQ